MLRWFRDNAEVGRDRLVVEYADRFLRRLFSALRPSPTDKAFGLSAARVGGSREGGLSTCDYRRRLRRIYTFSSDALHRAGLLSILKAPTVEGAAP